MCYPAPPEDPTREYVKAQNIGALVPRFRAAGADCVIVNGCLDPRRGPRLELMPQAAVTVRLRADHNEIARRLTGRQSGATDLGDLLKEILDEAEALDAGDFGDVCVDTTGVAATEVARLVRDSCRDWPGFNGSFPSDHLIQDTDGDPQDADGKILLICGPTAAGKSAVGFEVYLRYLRDGCTARYIDLDQIGFVLPGSANDLGRHRLKAGNLAAMWRTCRAAGATHLVATGPVDSEAALRTYLRALPADTRQPAEYLLRVADQVIADADALDRISVGIIRVDTDELTVVETADLIAGLTG